MRISSPNIPQSRQIWIVIVLGALSGFGPLSMDMYLPALPSMAKALNTSTSLAQLSLTSCLLGFAMGQIIAGPQSDVRGRRLPLLAGMVVYAVSSFLCALTSAIWILILLRFIQGMAGAAGMVISRAIVRDRYSGSEMTKFFALLTLVSGAGPIIAPIIGGQLLQLTSWRGVFIVLGIVGIVMFLAVLFTLPETLPPQRRSQAGIMNTLSIFGGLIRDPVFMGYALPQGLVTAAMFAYISGSPFVIQDIFGASPQLFSIFFAINGLGLIIASQITGKLAGRIAGTKLYIGGVVLATLGGISLLLMILIGNGLPAILPPLFVVVSSAGIVSTAGSSLALEHYGHSAGSASALLGLLMFVFGAIAAPLAGLGGSNTALPMGMVIAVADVSSLLCYAILRLRTNAGSSVKKV